jgi:DNA-binding CsgD family transcriptional regulator/pimeloyl-ACP methyl ester carboxylesterase
MNHPPIQYAHTSDGASIAYWVMRNGPPAVVQVPNVLSHLSNEWKLPEIAEWYQRLGAGRTLVTYDMRQMGLSVGPDYVWPDSANDLAAVLDAAGVQRAALLATWVGAWTALGFAAMHPERVSHLVLWGASTHGVDLWTDVTTAVAEVGLVDPDQVARHMLHASLGWSHGDFADRFFDTVLSASEQRFQGTARMGNTELLKQVNFDEVAAHLDVPTLVLHARENQMLAEGTARRLTASIPNAQLQLLDGESLFLPIGTPDEALEAINAFLAESGPTSQAESAEGTPTPTGPPYPDRLSKREVQVLRLVAAGMRNAEIADRLVISINTVTRHISNIFDKTGATNRTEATRYAIRNGLSE